MQSNYHALTARGERRSKSGFSLLSSFAWSKAISNAPQYRNAGGITGDENSPPQNSFDLAVDRSLAYFNAKLRWVTTAVYDLPFGRNRRLLNQGLGAALAGGWQLSGILQLQSGFPYTINYKGDTINIGGGSGGILVRPNYVLGADGKPVDPNLPSGQRRAEFFNLANHPNFNLIGRIVNDPTFGIVQNQLPPRQVQFGVKLSY